MNAAHRHRICVAYRDVDRTPLLYAIRELEAQVRAEHVELRQVADGEVYERDFLGGELDLICEHLRFLFPARLAGHPVRCLAACQNQSGDRLLARDGIQAPAELHGGRVAVRATQSSRISGEYWLRQLGLADSVQVVVVADEDVGRWQQWRKVVSGEADAVICSPLYGGRAIAAGLHPLGVPPFKEIGSLFFAALGPFVERNGDALLRFMRSLYRALHAFNHERDAALRIVAGEPARLMGLHPGAELERRFDRLRENLSERPLPDLEALSTTIAMLDEGYAPLAGLNPLSMWDLRFVIQLEEQRFMQELVTVSL